MVSRTSLLSSMALSNQRTDSAFRTAHERCSTNLRVLNIAFGLRSTGTMRPLSLAIQNGWLAISRASENFRHAQGRPGMLPGPWQAA